MLLLLWWYHAYNLNLITAESQQLEVTSKVIFVATIVTTDLCCRSCAYRPHFTPTLQRQTALVIDLNKAFSIFWNTGTHDCNAAVLEAVQSG